MFSHLTPPLAATVADAIRDCSKRGDIVLDGFGGSGTTRTSARI
ncbi:MAG: DNA methyltransferase [Brevundimonas sp.]